MQHLAKHKHEMLGEHKQQVFERFQELKQEHEQFWSKVREGRRQRTREFSSKIRDNLEKNHETLRKSTSALERFRAKADDLRDKISNSNSEKWTGIWSEWLAEAETKIDDIEAQINRIQGWIEEDEKKLGGNRW